jgi:antitoxin MazE
MRTHIRKWGNSLALRIPKSFADEVGIQRESEVEISLAEGGCILSQWLNPD